MDKTSISSSQVAEFRDRLTLLTQLLHQVLKTPSLSKDPDFLRQTQEIIRSLHELSKL